MGFMITIHRHWPSTWKGARSGAPPGIWAFLSSLREHWVPLFLSLSLLFSPLGVSSAQSWFLFLTLGLVSWPQSKYLGQHSLYLSGFCPPSCQLLFWLLFCSNWGQRVAAWPSSGCKSWAAQGQPTPVWSGTSSCFNQPCSGEASGKYGCLVPSGVPPSPQKYACTCAKSLQSCPTLCNPMDFSPPDSSVHGDSPSKNTGRGCHALLQGLFLTQELNLWLLCLLHWQMGSLPPVPPGKHPPPQHCQKYVYAIMLGIYECDLI